MVEDSIELSVTPPEPDKTPSKLNKALPKKPILDDEDEEQDNEKAPQPPKHAKPQNIPLNRATLRLWFLPVIVLIAWIPKAPALLGLFSVAMIIVLLDLTRATTPLIHRYAVMYFDKWLIDKEKAPRYRWPLGISYFMICTSICMSLFPSFIFSVGLMAHILSEWMMEWARNRYKRIKFFDSSLEAVCIFFLTFSCITCLIGVIAKQSAVYYIAALVAAILASITAGASSKLYFNRNMTLPLLACGLLWAIQAMASAPAAQ